MRKSKPGENKDIKVAYWIVRSFGYGICHPLDNCLSIYIDIIIPSSLPSSFYMNL